MGKRAFILSNGWKPHGCDEHHVRALNTLHWQHSICCIHLDKTQWRNSQDWQLAEIFPSLVPMTNTRRRTQNELAASDPILICFACQIKVKAHSVYPSDAFGGIVDDLPLDQSTAFAGYDRGEEDTAVRHWPKSAMHKPLALST